MSQVTSPAWTEPSIEQKTFSISVLRLSGKSLNATLFRQLPVLEIADENGDAIFDVQPWGVVRHESKGGGVWFLFIHAGKLYRCAIFAKASEFYKWQVDQAYGKSSLLLKSKDPTAQANERSQEAAEARRKYEIEIRRAAVHQHAEGYSQLFIGA